MNKNDALKILGFSEGANPQEWELKGFFERKYRSIASQNLQGLGCWLKEFNTACEFLLKQFYGPTRKPYYYADPDYIYSLADLHLVLFSAVKDGNIEILKKVFSKFKSSKDGQFGDYINRPYAGPRGVRIKPYIREILFYAVQNGNIKIVELILKNGADPNIKLISREDLLDFKIKKVLFEYGRSFIDIGGYEIFQRQSLIGLIIGSMSLMVSFLDGVTPFERCAAAFIGGFFIAISIYDMWHCKSLKSPSFDFDEVNAEKAVTNVGLNAEGNSRESGDALV